GAFPAGPVSTVADRPRVGAHAAGEEERPDRVIVLDEQSQIGVHAAGKPAPVGGTCSGVEAILGQVAFGTPVVRTETKHVAAAYRGPNLHFAAEPRSRRI